MMDKKYDLIIIGGGSAGLVAAISAGAIGAKTALVENKKIGGECSWTGCVPSKALISYAAKVKTFRHFLESENIMEPHIADRVFTYVRAIRKKASKASKAMGLLKRYGVDIVFGNPSFEDNRVLSIDGRKYHAKKYIISTGSSPMVPKIKGLGPYFLTNRNIWDLNNLPKSMVILGAGPIGVEMAQSFNRLGTKVDVVELSGGILAKDDRELSRNLLNLLKKEGISFHLETRVKEVKIKKDTCILDLGLKKIKAQKLLIATGRKANTKGLNLEAAGVKFSRKSIQVDKYLRTTSPKIFAVGDCNGIYQFSHIAEIEAKTSVRNALFPLNSKVNYQGVPWTTFTNPELAHLGLTEEECNRNNIKYSVFKHPFKGDDRAIIEEDTEGMVKILSNSLGRIIGAHILGPRAGELINELVLARRKSLKIYDIGLTSHVYPSLGMAVQRATDDWFSYMTSKGFFRSIIRFMRHP